MPLLDFDALGNIDLLPPRGIELLTGAFFHSLEVLRIPLVLLGVALLWSLLLGWGSMGRTLPFLAARRRRYAVVLIGAEEVLPVHESPDADSPVVHNLAPTTRDVTGVGRTRQQGGITWLKVETAHGDGWVDAYHLTEQVDDDEFADDGRPRQLLDKLAAAFEGRQRLSSIVTERGLFVSFGAAPKHIPAHEVDELVTSTQLRVWREADMVVPSVRGTFVASVAAPFVVGRRGQGVATSIDEPVLVSALIPTEFLNFHFISFGTGGAVGSWMVFFEYVDAKPRVVGLSVDH